MELFFFRGGYGRSRRGTLWKEEEDQREWKPCKRTGGECDKDTVYACMNGSTNTFKMTVLKILDHAVHIVMDSSEE